MDATQLARMTIRVLDLQAAYFKTRATEKLQECKRAEAELRKACKEILHPEGKQPTLFQTLNEPSE